MNKGQKSLGIILNYKTYELTISLVESLLSMNIPNFDILVIDNNSPNESNDILKEHSRKNGYLYIHNNTNSGYAAGNNIGLRYSVKHNYSYSIVMNNDIVLQKSETITKLIQVLDSDPLIACCGPKVVDTEGKSVAPYLFRPSFYDLTFGLNKYRRHTESTDSVCNAYKIFGCFVGLKNTAIAQIDYYDERTFLFCEEDILAERLLAAGYCTKYVGSCEVIHLGSVTVDGEESANGQKYRILKESSKLYLGEYRHFSKVQISVILVLRKAIMKIRTVIR